MRYLEKTQRGFSLIEILVGMLIGLMGIIIIFQVFAVSEDIKRTSTSGGDAQQFGALGLYNIERDLRMSGYGINNDLVMGCTVRAFDDTATPKDLPNFTATPVEIVFGGNNATPDSLSVMYGSADLRSAATPLTQDMVSATSNFQVANRFGYIIGSVVLAAEPGKDCVIAEVTDAPTAAGQTDLILHNTGGYTDANGNPATATYNKAAGLGVTYTTDGMLFNLGMQPIRNTYSIQNNQLVMTRMFTSGTVAPVADYIVSLKAMYGKDDGINNGTVNNAVYVADDGIVDGYDDSMPVAPTTADWKRNLTIRVALLARSAQPERPNVAGGACDATAAAPTWSLGSFDLTADANWQCYRYRVFETTVPLRNLMWAQL